jgi:Rieske 2Fe-2S family protein
MSSTELTTNCILQKSLPSSYYLSDQIFGEEKEKIFCHEWLCAGRAEQIAEPGNYLVLDILGESILVVRSKDGEIKAHYNVCRHRGTRLVPSADEELPKDIKFNGGVLGANGIRCPYHLWTYGLDGRLLNAPHVKESKHFCKEEFSLYQANWKILMENYNECYHCGPVHPELCEVVPAFQKRGGSELEWERGVPHKEGATTFTRTGKTSRAPFPGLNDDEKVRHKGELIYPNMMVSLACDHVAAFTLWPVGPKQTTVICDFLFHPGEMKKPEFDPSDAVDFWDLVNRQDWEICKRVQQGLGTQVHKFGYYAPMEDSSLDIQRYVLERLGKERA